MAVIYQVSAVLLVRLIVSPYYLPLHLITQL